MVFAGGQFYILLIAAGLSVVLALVELSFYAFTVARKSKRRLDAPRRSFGSVFKEEVFDALGCGPTDNLLPDQKDSPDIFASAPLRTAAVCNGSSAMPDKRSLGPQPTRSGPAAGYHRQASPQAQSLLRSSMGETAMACTARLTTDIK